LSAARARLAEQRGELQRHRKLFRDGWVAKAKLDKVQAAFNAATSDEKAAQAEVELRDRDLRLAVMRAPFNGVISKKMVQAFQEVAPGESIYQLDSVDGLKVDMQIPADMIAKMERAQPVQVSFPTVPNVKISGLIHEIGAQADAGNSFPLTVVLVGGSADLRAGMSAEVAFTYRSESPDTGYMVPPTAILAGADDTQYVFRFDVGTSKLQKVPVALQTLRDNRIGVTGDISHGDVVAIAGVEFLADGLEVRLMNRP
ncbi:MAG: efflux RND transporter periplasmic adaptor subunit, partial [Alphaproteobacteria bacterium]|nr:efflux RND transporter periplasmic adaptor subunit [Alphaproteobacteria bacterium]